MRIEYPKLAAKVIRDTATFKITPQVAHGIYSPSFQQDASSLAITGHTVVIDCGTWIGRPRTMVEINPTLRFNVLESIPENHRAKFIASELLYGTPHTKMREIAGDKLSFGVTYKRDLLKTVAGLGIFNIGPSNLHVLIRGIEEVKKPQTTTELTIKHPMEEVYESDVELLDNPETKQRFKFNIGENILVTDMNEILQLLREGLIIDLFMGDSTDSIFFMDNSYNLGLEIEQGINGEIKISKTNPQNPVMNDILVSLITHLAYEGRAVLLNSKDPIINTEYTELSASYENTFLKKGVDLFLDDFTDFESHTLFFALIKKFLESGIRIALEFGSKPPSDIKELEECLQRELEKEVHIEQSYSFVKQNKLYVVKP